MDVLESQIAKIQLGNFKHTNSYVYVMAEKAAGSPAELYIIAELPLFNPAAAESCEQICLAIGSTLKRAYRKPLDSNSFENAIALINEELGKLAVSGQTGWINKLNSIIAVKEGNVFTIATCGKTTAFLLRNNEFSDISCEPGTGHPLKTFENYAVGRLRLGDLLILSTTQLFNHISIDRLKKILFGYDFLTATQTIIETIKSTAAPQIAFGVLLNLQVAPGEVPNEDIDLDDYVLEQPKERFAFFSKAKNFVLALLMLDKSKRQATQVSQPPTTLKQKLSAYKNTSINYYQGGKKVLYRIISFAQAIAKLVNPKNFKEYSPQKKFFFLSALILLLALIINLSVAIHYKSINAEKQQAAQGLDQAQKLLANAETSLVYNDQKAAIDYFKQAKDQFSKINSKMAVKDVFSQTQEQFNVLNKKLEKIQNVQTTSLGSLGSGQNLINTPDFLAIYSNGQIVSYNKKTSQIQDGVLKSGEIILDSIAVKDDTSAIYNGSSLYVWEPQSGKLGPAFSTSLPDKNSIVSLKFYPSNSRVYVLDKANMRALSFLINANTIQKPIVSLVGIPEIAKAQDFAIDGSIYILTDSGIIKYSAGKLADFNMPYLSSPFEGSGKIYTEVGFKNLYLMDAKNKRILILDKKGNLVSTLTSDSFTNLVDFSVDENTRTIYLLNDSSLLKLNF